MAYAVVIYAYFCRSCRRWLYIVNAKGSFRSRGEYFTPCSRCGRPMKYKGKVRVVVPREDYDAFLKARTFRRAPIPLPKNMGGSFDSWAEVGSVPEAVAEPLEVGTA